MKIEELSVLKEKTILKLYGEGKITAAELGAAITRKAYGKR